MTIIFIVLIAISLLNKICHYPSAKRDKKKTPYNSHLKLCGVRSSLNNASARIVGLNRADSCALG